MTGHVRNSLLQRLLFLFQTGHYYMVIFSLPLNTSLQTKNCTVVIWFSASDCRSRTITDADTKRHAHTHTHRHARRALCCPCEQTPPASRSIPLLSPTTHAPRWEQETTYWFSLPPGRTGSSTVDPWRLLPSPWCCPLFFPLSSRSS